MAGIFFFACGQRFKSLISPFILHNPHDNGADLVSEDSEC